MRKKENQRTSANTSLTALLACLAMLSVGAFSQLGGALQRNLTDRPIASEGPGADRPHAATDAAATDAAATDAAATNGAVTVGSFSAAGVSGSAARFYARAAEALAPSNWQGRVAYTLATGPRFADGTIDEVPANLRARNISPFGLQQAIEQLLPVDQRALQISAGSEQPITPSSIRTEFQGRRDAFGTVLSIDNRNPRALTLSPEIKGEFSYIGAKRGIMVGCCGPSGSVCCGVPANPEDFSMFLESLKLSLEPGGIAVLQGAIQQPFLLNTSRKLHLDSAVRFAESSPDTTTFLLADGIDSGLAIVNAPRALLPELAEFESSAFLDDLLALGSAP